MSRKPKDLTGQKFGNLVVKEYAGKIGTYPSWWVECTCGKTFTVPAYTLHRGDAVGCPFCQAGVAAVPLLWQGQRMTILPYHTHINRPAEYIGGVVKQLIENDNADAVVVMLHKIPAGSLQNLGSELEDNAAEADSADSAAEEWENNATHFDKPLDK